MHFEFSKALYRFWGVTTLLSKFRNYLAELIVLPVARLVLSDDDVSISP